MIKSDQVFTCLVIPPFETTFEEAVAHSKKFNVHVILLQDKQIEENITPDENVDIVNIFEKSAKQVFDHDLKQWKGKAAVCPWIASEDYVVFAHELGELLSSNYCSSEVAKLIRNKYQLRRRLCAAGLDETRSIEATTTEDLELVDFFPCFLKPASGVGSKSSTRCNNREELEAAFQDAQKLIKTCTRHRLWSDTKSCVVEEYLHGLEVDVELTIVNGQLFYAEIMDNEGPHIHQAPSVLSEEQQSHLIDWSVKVAIACGVTTGSINIECFVRGMNIYFVEINNRLAAGQDLFTGHRHHFPISHLCIDIALGNQLSVPTLKNIPTVVMYVYLNQTITKVPERMMKWLKDRGVFFIDTTLKKDDWIFLTVADSKDNLWASLNELGDLKNLLRLHEGYE